MDVLKAARSFSFGLLIAIIAIGLLPFLLVYCMGDVNGLNDLNDLFEHRISFFNYFK